MQLEEECSSKKNAARRRMQLEEECSSKKNAAER
jgi:hypothetical protein